MKKSVKILMLLNLISYISNFAFAFMHSCIHTTNLHYKVM